MAYVYFLFSEKDENWYIGYTCLDIMKRFSRHAGGYERSTKYRRPLRLAYYEIYEDKKICGKREWFLKHPKGYQDKLLIIAMLLKQKGSWPIIRDCFVKEQ